MGVIVDRDPPHPCLCILVHRVTPGHTSLSYCESVVKLQPLTALPNKSRFFQSLHFILGPLTPQERGTSSSWPVTCLLSSFELSREAWDWKTLCVVREGIDTDTSVISFESSSHTFSSCCKLHLLMEVM